MVVNSPPVPGVRLGAADDGGHAERARRAVHVVPIGGPHGLCGGHTVRDVVAAVDDIVASAEDAAAILILD
eukprot:3172334-Prymnesium_polylepis.1